MEIPSEIKYEKNGRTAIITIDRPDAMNALTPAMLRGIDAAMAEFEADDELLCAVLTASGEKAFCTGMDLKEAMPLLTSGDEMGYEDHTKRQFTDVFKPIIAAVNGYCIAGGLEMLQGTDIRIAAEHAVFGLGEVRWGIIPTGGSHVKLPRQIPWAIAMELLLTGENLDARRACEIGLVNRVVPADEVMPTALKLAEKIGRNGPLAVRTAKQIAVRSMNFEPGLVLEKALGAKVLASEDAKEGPLAFTEKRRPEFKGR